MKDNFFSGLLSAFIGSIPCAVLVLITASNPNLMTPIMMFTIALALVCSLPLGFVVGMLIVKE